MFLLSVIFWITMVLTITGLFGLCFAIIVKAFMQDIDIGVRAVLATLMGIIIPFIFYKFNKTMFDTFASFSWVILFGSSFLFMIIILAIVTAIEIPNSAISSSLFCFSLMFGLVFSLLVIFYRPESATNEKIQFIPLGYFIGAAVYIILNRKISFKNIFTSTPQIKK